MEIEKPVHKNLMDLISSYSSDERRIIQILEDPQNQTHIKEIVNHPTQDIGQETMLMMAVWTKKEKVVAKLIEKGADVTFANDHFQSVSTYWNLGPMSSEKEQKLALRIAKILHESGAILSRNTPATWDLVTRAREYNLSILLDGLDMLGYT